MLDVVSNNFQEESAILLRRYNMARSSCAYFGPRNRAKGDDERIRLFDELVRSYRSYDCSALDADALCVTESRNELSRYARAVLVCTDGQYDCELGDAFGSMTGARVELLPPDEEEGEYYTGIIHTPHGEVYFD